MIFTRFIVTIPVYNAEDYIRECLCSVINQSYKNYKAIVTDDCSTDRTWEIIKETLVKQEEFFVAIRNNRRRYVLYNIVQSSRLPFLSPEDVIVNLDGDDKLIGSDVFTELAIAYNNKDTWATFGQLKPFSESWTHLSYPVKDIKNYRDRGPWIFSHLRTYKKWLFDKIKDEDLRDLDGEYYKLAGDCALIYPVVEMCGNKHIVCLNKEVYNYNDINIINDANVDRLGQESTKHRIRSKKPYEQID
jgi:glycosyltransferase involved in cell wall biosynthesis